MELPHLSQLPEEAPEKEKKEVGSMTLADAEETESINTDSIIGSETPAGTPPGRWRSESTTNVL